VKYVWPHRMGARPSRERIRAVLGFSLKSQIGWVADLVNLQTDKIVIGLLVSAKAAGTYQLGSSVAGGIRTLGAISVSAMIPSATAAISTEGRQAVRRLALHYLPRALGVALPVFAASALVAPFLFVAWIGGHTRGAIVVVIALNAAYAVNILTAVPSTISIADGRPGFVSRNSLGMAALNVVLTLALAPILGLDGVVLGTVVAVVLFSVIFVVSFARLYGLSGHDMWAAIAPSALLSLLLCAPLVPVVLVTRHLAVNRASAAGILIAVDCVYAAVYWPAASRLGILPERLTLKRMRPKLAATAGATSGGGR
jgi:O-antigen/teichoic acid export membrane protein